MFFVGGGCLFESCVGATCNGGRYSIFHFVLGFGGLQTFDPLFAFSLFSCTFRDPAETLKGGYCEGGSCNIDGYPHPDLNSHLTI
jgi:hypothetical protein